MKGRKIHYRVPDAAPSPKSVRYSHCVEADGWLHVSGQLPVDPDAADAPPPLGVEAQSELCFLNLQRIISHAGYGFPDTVFVRVYLADFDRDFPKFNEVYHRYFDDDEVMPSRTTFGVAKLGRNALVEIDMTLYRPASRSA